MIKIKPFINKYNWKGINIPSEKDVWKKSETNNVTIALNILYAKEEKLYPAYVSKYNSNREKQVILFMISKREKCVAQSEGLLWDYLAVKKLSTLLKRITSKYNGDCYCLNCLLSFITKKQTWIV